jgi:hypothetical protein
VTSVAQSACLRDIQGNRAVKLFIEFVVVPPPLDTIFDFQAPYRSDNLPLKYEQLVFLPFSQHPHFTAVEQDWADQGFVNGLLPGVKGGSTANVCAVRRNTYLQSGFFVVFPESRHSLVSSGILDTHIF